MHKILTLLFLLLASNSFAANNIKITNWQENATLNESGKNSEILIQAKISGLAPQFGITSFSLGFDPTQKINITKVVCDNKPADFQFSQNNLTVKFPKAKKNNDTVWIYFSFDETYDRINKFLREEAVIIPAFAAGAEAKVAINFAQNLESATLNTHVKKEPNRFLYSNIVPENGVMEIVKLTPAESFWDIAVEVKVASTKPLGQISFSFPDYFQSPQQKVENYSIATNATALSQKTEARRRKFSFNSKAQEITIQNRAKISTGKAFRQPYALDKNKYLSVTPEDKILLTPLLERIKTDPKYSELPLYAKIGQYVHDYIKYDKSYMGRLPKINEILSNKVGVCTEYANLFNSLARTANIPSIAIHGGACGEFNICEGHSWNLIFVDNSWIQVDPTWNLMSGIVSSSHVYLNDEDNDEVNSEYRDTGAQVTSNIELHMKNLF
jgi:transglutaminase-like putative cysteine protease